MFDSLQPFHVIKKQIMQTGHSTPSMSNSSQSFAFCHQRTNYAESFPSPADRLAENKTEKKDQEITNCYYRHTVPCKMATDKWRIWWCLWRSGDPQVHGPVGRFALIVYSSADVRWLGSGVTSLRAGSRCCNPKEMFVNRLNQSQICEICISK